MSRQDEGKIPATVTFRCPALVAALGNTHTCGEHATGTFEHGGVYFPACAKHGGK